MVRVVLLLLALPLLSSAAPAPRSVPIVVHAPPAHVATVTPRGQLHLSQHVTVAERRQSQNVTMQSAVQTCDEATAAFVRRQLVSGTLANGQTAVVGKATAWSCTSADDAQQNLAAQIASVAEDVRRRFGTVVPTQGGP